MMHIPAEFYFSIPSTGHVITICSLIKERWSMLKLTKFLSGFSKKVQM
uniref:Uncharacterized protein n=1 Tax=Rhizophora mucronata TaxID=61149 RepID=A0A2P2PNJ7_RHIMU